MHNPSSDAVVLIVLAMLAACAPRVADRRAQSVSPEGGAAIDGKESARSTSQAASTVPDVAAATTSPSPTTDAIDSADRFIAFGNEPFWSVEVADGALLWKTPDNPAGTRLPASRVPTLQGWRWAGRDAARDYSLDVLAGECSDGMSDRRHAYSARWTFDGQTFEGCARKPGPPPGE